MALRRIGKYLFTESDKLVLEIGRSSYDDDYKPSLIPSFALPIVRFPIVPSAIRKHNQWPEEVILEIAYSSPLYFSCYFCETPLVTSAMRKSLHDWFYHRRAIDSELTKGFVDIVRCRYRNRSFEFSDEWVNSCCKPLNVDHDLPVYRGGSDDIDNLALLCRSCNSQKGIMTLGEYTEWLRAGCPGNPQAEIRSVLWGLEALDADLLSDLYVDDDDNSLWAQARRALDCSGD